MVRTSAHVSALFGLHLFIFGGVYLSADSFPGDFGTLYYTLPAYWVAAVSAGEWPAWIPTVGMGMPLGAIPQSGILYPPLWIFPALHLPYTLKAASVLQALHVFAGAAGAYALVRRIFGAPNVGFVAGAAYLCYGGFYVNAQHTDIVRTFALLPWLLWALWLPSDRLRGFRIRHLTLQSALGPVNLLLPAVALLLITGGYAGQVEALVCAVPVFVALQLARNWRAGQRFAAAAGDLVVLVALLALGCLLTSAFMLPLVSASDELTRSSGGPLAPDTLIYLRLTDLYGLVMSSTFVRPDLHRDIGMQLPLALFPFVACLRARTARMLLPFFGVSAIALVMALDVVSGVSQAVIHVFPLLGYSRFPAGDYRTLCALAVLLALAGGARDAIMRLQHGQSIAHRYVFGLVGLGVVLASAFMVIPAKPEEALDVLVRQSMPALVVALLLVLATRRVVLQRALPVLVAGLCFASAWPVLTDLRADWRAEDAERWLLDDAGMKLWEDRDGMRVWRVDSVVQQQFTARPPRNSKRKYPNEISWNGYLNGEFLTRDDNGAILLVRRVAERTPELMAFMRKETSLVAVACSSGVCDNLSGADVKVPAEVLKASAHPGFTWQPVNYASTSLHYQVNLAEPALVIENELYARGWRANVDGHADGATPPLRVNGAVRGWHVPAGEHDLYLSFETPGLELGTRLSAIALLFYCVVLVVGWRLWLAREKTIPDPQLVHDQPRPGRIRLNLAPQLFDKGAQALD